MEIAGVSTSNHLTAEQRNTGLLASDARVQQAAAVVTENLEPEGETDVTDPEEDKDIIQTSAQSPSHQESSKAKRRAERKERHFNVVLTAARATIGILHKHGIPCTVFGGLACKLYGSSRCPKDVDLLVSQPSSSDANTVTRTAEEIKVMILDNDPQHFYLKLPRDPEATYRKLYYRQYYRGPKCKVDILFPGTMHLPNIPIVISTLATSNASLIPLTSNDLLPSPHPYLTTISGIPLVPFSLLLLHKLQGWDDNGKASGAHKRKKRYQDAADIRRLLATGKMVNELRQIHPWADSSLFSEEFQLLTKERIKDFCKVFPDGASVWQSFGFEIS